MSSRCWRWFASFVFLCSAVVQAQEPKRVDRYGDELPPGAVVRLGSVRFQHASWLTAVAYSPDGKLLATSSHEKEIALWELPSGRLRCHLSLADHRGAFELLFSPDGKYLAATCDYFEKTSRLQVWEVATGKKTLEITKDWRPSSYCLAFSPDSKWLGATIDGVVRLYDPSGIEDTHILHSYSGLACALAILENEKCFVLTADAGRIALWEVPDNKKRYSIMTDMKYIQRAVFAPDRRSYALGGSEKTVSVRALDGKELFKLDGHQKAINSLAYSADGKMIVTNSEDGSTRLWDAKTGKVRGLVGADEYTISAAIFSPDGKTLASSGPSCVNAVRLFDTGTGKELIPRPSHRAPIVALAFAPDGKRIVTASGEGPVRLWNAATGEPLRDFASSLSFVRSVAFAPDGKEIATAGCYERAPCVRVWNVASGMEVRRLNGDKLDLRSLAFSPDGKRLAGREVAGDSNVSTLLRIWDRESGKQGLTIPVEQDGQCGFSSDGRLLFEATEKMRFWDARTGKPVLWSAEKQSRADSAAFSANGHFLATSCYQGETRLWDFAAEQFLAKLPGSLSIAFSPDGRFVALGEQQTNSVQLYDMAMSRECHSFKGHTGLICSLSFSPDGTQLVSGSYDNTALVWDMSDLTKRYPLKADGEITAKNLDKWWSELLHKDAAKAQRAAWNLTAAGDAAVLLLKTKVRPATEEEAARMPQFIKELDADEFEVREKATKELAQLGFGVREALHEALDETKSPEARRRLESILNGAEEPDTAGEGLRSRRAVLVLERIGTPEAKTLLQTLAKGAADARLTHDAQAALTRLARRGTPEK